MILGSFRGCKSIVCSVSPLFVDSFITKTVTRRTVSDVNRGTMMKKAKVEGEGLQSFVILNDGNKMPLFGLGTWRSTEGDETEGAVLSALQNGYRMIDTAQLYCNEKSVGRGLKQSGLKREDVFVVTKIDVNNHGFDKCTESFHESLRRLDTSYVDLLLVHTPTGGHNLETWDAMTNLKQRGLVRSIGVSNFGPHQLEEMFKGGRPLPAVNQIELHPFWRKENIVEYCLEKGIAVMGYCPLFRGKKNHEPVLVDMANRYGKTVAQLLIGWSVQKGYITIPKSTNSQRIIANSQVFDFSISDEDMKVLDSMPTEQCANLDDPTVKPWTG